MRRRDTIWVAGAADLSASLAALWITLQRPETGQWLLLAAVAVALCLALMASARFLQIRALARAGTDWARRTALGVGVSLVGWAALVALFALRLICPEFEIHPAWVLSAFAAHILGALWALYVLRSQP